MSPLDELRAILWRVGALCLGLAVGVLIAAALLPHHP